MGDFTLGCLLGQYDRAQSFDVASVGTASWAAQSWQTNVGSYFFHTSVHSSPQGVRYQVGSQGAAHFALRYNYDAANDIGQRQFPDVSTHRLRADFWARSDVDSKFSQDFSGLFGDNDLYIGSSGVMRPYRAEGVLTNGLGAGAQAQVRNAARLTQPGILYVDDLLVQVDGIAVYPDYGFQARRQALKGEFRTQGGRLHTVLWSSFDAFTLPLRFLSNSHASLINWWWQGQFALALTLNTSDADSIRLVRILNGQQPIGRKQAPYGLTQGGWQGVLELEALSAGDLVF